ncbi:PhoH family protein [candidate division FCPU426 bacterium]|nr:PhoH family protein [candidate division FCPU426 bacterium]
MKKTFILDTNVLLHNPEAIRMFEDNYVVIPIVALEELDKFKKLNDEKGKNARAVSRFVDGLRSKGSLSKGVEMENGGILRIPVETPDIKLEGLSLDRIDNQILALAMTLQQRGADNIRLVTKDVNLRVKAEVFGVKAEDFESHKVNIDELYSGVATIEQPVEVINQFYTDKKIPLPDHGLNPNQFVIIKDMTGSSSQSAVGRVSWKEQTVVPLAFGEQEVWSIKAKNLRQKFAFELLLDHTIPLVTMLGPAGTGKTLLAIAAALRCTLDERRYRRILVSRPVIPLGRDIGYLPGTKEEKIAPWMQPIFDNLEFLMDQNGESEETGEGTLRYLNESGKIILESLTYIRGRSIPKQFIIVDEAQNLTPHEVKTIVSRAGEGSKVVLTGDPYQIDNPYLDSNSNGLTYLVEHFQSQELFGHVTLTKSERSSLAALAAKLL